MTPAERTKGPPPSANGASSFHLLLEAPPGPLVEVEATVQVIEPPSVPKLYFWALQVSFHRGARPVGGAHLGLQHHPAYAEGGAVNWGGYADAGGELGGSASELPSALGNVNTRTFPWEPGRRYRYRVRRSPDRGWRGSITDRATGVETVVRDLWVDADHLRRPLVWSEVFADCDDPATAVRWTDLAVVTAEGRRIEIDAARLSYQTHHDGGCANTETSVELSGVRAGFVQRTTTPRVHHHGSRLSLS